MTPPAGSEESTLEAFAAAYTVCQTLKGRGLRPDRVYAAEHRAIVVIHQHGPDRIVTVCMADGETLTVE